MDGLIVLCVVVVSLILSKVVKLFFFDNFTKAMLAGGGMPSSHCASASALVSMIFFVEGLTTTFIVALAFAVVVIVDAVRVRRAVGINAKLMRELLHKKHCDDVMVENGHTIPEAVWGIVLGIVVASIAAVIV